MLDQENPQAQKLVKLSEKKSGVMLKPEQAEAVAEIIGQCFDVQNTFGKTVEQLPTIIKAFLWALQGYSYAQIEEAFRIHIKSSRNMPTPFDIRQIIDPIEEEWKPDWGTFNALKKLKEEGGEFALTSEEAAYFNRCMDFNLAAGRQR